MSTEKLLGLPRSGDLIILPGGGQAPLRLAMQALPGGTAGAEQKPRDKARRLLRNLIAIRKDGKNR